MRKLQVGKPGRWIRRKIPLVFKSLYDQLAVLNLNVVYTEVLMPIGKFPMRKGSDGMQICSIDDFPSFGCDLTDDMAMINGGKTPCGCRSFFLKHFTGFDIY
jgi:hypothetical protein